MSPHRQPPMGCFLRPCDVDEGDGASWAALGEGLGVWAHTHPVWSPAPTLMVLRQEMGVGQGGERGCQGLGARVPGAGSPRLAWLLARSSHAYNPHPLSPSLGGQASHQPHFTDTS